ncbi:sugar ABC transporter permease [Mycoplasma marinum]|uniref:ABC transmembrane type-1 domain-containing protein n=1 Tax=Mycoplasma marinum TaxID=1937190 RepID=A0A4R0XQP7_9MOLU|nr:sugar ABC transporter permease [Mycoplasma marinum]TCG11918.1 hypothetical protein C4B24_00785 [Mycoplasma marinum]
MAEHNFKEIATLNEELDYKYKPSLNIKQNQDALISKIKKIIFSKILDFRKINDEKLKEELKVELELLVSNPLKKITSWEEIELKKLYVSSKEIKGIKERLNFPEKSREMQILYKKELVAIEAKKAKVIAKKTKWEDKTGFLAKKMNKSFEIKLAKINIREKDLKSFIKNKSILKKVYLSDEPPLTPAGWVKLFLSYGFMLLWALIILWPLAELVKATLNNNAIKTLNTSSYEFGFDSFSRLFGKTDFVNWMTNTLIIAGITSAATVFLALLMGYAFSRFRFKGKKSSLISVMLLQMVPSLAALTVFYVLYTILNQKFNLSGSVVLILIYVGGGVAGNTFIMKGYMDSISTEIDEAAKIDGLSQWRIFTRIIVPLTKPMIALVGLWSFIGPFGDYILPGLLLSDSKTFTLAKGLQTLASDPKTMDQGAFAAGAILVAVPVSLLFISLRKFLVGGITAGGVKG